METVAPIGECKPLRRRDSAAELYGRAKIDVAIGLFTNSAGFRHKSRPTELAWMPDPLGTTREIAPILACSIPEAHQSLRRVS